MDIGFGEAIRVALLAVLRHLPSWIVGRFYPDNKVAANVAVDLTSVRRIDFRFSGDIPEILVALRVTNLNPFPVQLDRLVVDLWIGQPVVKNHPVFVDRTVGAYSVDPPVVWDSGVLNTHAPVLIEFQLDELKLASIRQQVQGGRLTNNLILRIDAHGIALRRAWSKRNQRIEVSTDELPPLHLGAHEFPDLTTVQPGSIARSVGSS